MQDASNLINIRRISSIQVLDLQGIVESLTFGH